MRAHGRVLVAQRPAHAISPSPAQWLLKTRQRPARRIAVSAHPHAGAYCCPIAAGGHYHPMTRPRIERVNFYQPHPGRTWVKPCISAASEFPQFLAGFGAERCSVPAVLLRPPACPAPPLCFTDAFQPLRRPRPRGHAAVKLAPPAARLALVPAGRALAGLGPADDAAAGGAGTFGCSPRSKPSAFSVASMLPTVLFSVASGIVMPD